MKIRILPILMMCLVFGGHKVSAQYDLPENGNPLVPGYFADPTIKKFGDTWYLYATTDGIKLASGDPQVWVSKDFKNWSNYKMELPNRKSEDVWAPEIVQGPDSRYYYFFSSCRSNYGGCNIFAYVSDTPIGPWESLTTNGEPVIPSNFYEPVIPLDPNIFIDDDGSYYIYFCTWAVYDGNGIGWAKMNPDMKSFSDRGLIPNTQLPDVFEAPFMFKKDDVYYLSYSAGSTHDGTYRVMYSTSDSPTGTFVAGANLPITQTNSDKTIEAPAHHSFFKDGDDYYIAYHRHDNPHSTGGLVRQVCVDHVTFGEGKIEKVNLTHTGVGLLGTNQIPSENLGLSKTATASSFYTDEVHNYEYLPKNAIDDNNGTIWKADTTNMNQWLQIDLETTETIKRVLTDFEYPIYYYQYLIEYSIDGESWSVFADKRTNKQGGSPMLDDGDITARFLRISITGVQKPGLYPAIWNVRVYKETSDYSVFENPEQTEGPAIITRGNKLVDINASGNSSGEVISAVTNQGTLEGTFNVKGEITIEDVDDRRAFYFGGSDYLQLNKKTPISLIWNSPFTVSAWVHNPKIGPSECIVAWAKRGGPLGTYAAVNYGSNGSWGATAHWDYPDMGYKKVPEANQWHHIAVTFDGGVERIFVDGTIDNMEQKNLYVHSNGNIMVGFSGEAIEYFSGSLASLEMYDYALSAAEVKELYADTACKATTLFPQFQLEQGSLLSTTKVGVNVGTTVKLHPNLNATVTDSENWSWTGPNGFTADSRDVTFLSISEAEFGNYTVTYVNDCDVSSEQIFTIDKGATTLADTYSACSAENESCGYIGKVNIAYGSEGNYFYYYNMDGSFDCSSAIYGNPAPEATDKQCYVQAVGIPYDGNIAPISESSTSYVSGWETLGAINDGEVPTSSTDKTNGAYGNWPNPNSYQWVQYNWEQNYYITKTDIYWFTDNGGLLIPIDAYVEYWDGNAWVKWGSIGVDADKYNEFSSGTVYTNSLRLTFKNDKESTGILEWRVFGTLKEIETSSNVVLEKENGTRIFPNPTNSSFTIAFDNVNQGEEVKLNIFDMFGKEKYHSVLTRTKQITLNRASIGLDGAMYFVKIEINGVVQTHKLILY